MIMDRQINKVVIALVMITTMGCTKQAAMTAHYKADKVTKITIDEGGTTVTLNAGSELWYKKPFDNVLKFTGEAFIEVDSTRSRFSAPLHMNAGGFAMTCRHGVVNANLYAFIGGDYQSYSSAFNRGYVSVISGEVRWGRYRLKDWVFEVDPFGGAYPHSSLEPGEMTGWKDGGYHFQHIAIQDFLALFRAWYHFDTFLVAPDGYVSFDNFDWDTSKSLDDFIQTARRLAEVKITYYENGKHVLVEGIY